VQRRPRRLGLQRGAGGGRAGARLSPPDDVAPGGLSAAVAPPCPSAPDARGAGLWAVSSDARRGPRRLPHGAWATAGGAPTSPGLADRVCAAWGGPSRAVSHCGQRLVCTGVIPRGGAPPPVRAGERAA